MQTKITGNIEDISHFFILVVNFARLVVIMEHLVVILRALVVKITTLVVIVKLWNKERRMSLIEMAFGFGQKP
jgi:hypothetical protein